MKSSLQIWLQHCLSWSYAPWVGIPLVFILLLGTGWLREQRGMWNFLLYFWTGVSFLVFVHALTVRRREGSILPGLIATVALGLPPAGLTLLGYSLSFADLPLALAADEETLGKDIFESSKDDPRPPAFLFALDISQSVTPQIASLSVAESVLTKVFTASDPFHPLVPDGSCTTILAFASETQIVETIGHFGSGECADFGTNLDGLAGKVVKILRRKPAGQETATTDLLDFLRKLVTRLDEVDDRYSLISILLVSDLYHDKNPDGLRQAERDRWEEIQKDIRSLGPQVQFMVLLDEGLKKGFRLRPQQDALRPMWREVPLSEFLSADREQQLALLALNLFPSVETPKLRLKYIVGPQREAITSHIELPVLSDYQRLALGLVPGTGDESSMSRVRLSVKDRDDRTSILETAPPWGQVRLLNQAGSKLDLRLANPIDLGRATQCELLVAVPKQGRVYRIPIEIIPILPESSRSFFILLVVFSFFALLALTLHALNDGLLKASA